MLLSTIEIMIQGSNTVEELQELMVVHCASEIQNLSHIPLRHFSHKGGDEILQKLFTTIEANV